MTNEWLWVQPPQKMNPMSLKRALRLMYPKRKRIPKLRRLAHELKRDAREVRRELVALAGWHSRHTPEQVVLAADIYRESGPVGGWRVSVPRSLRPVLGRWLTG